jgi:hypothetical protein
MGGDWDGNVARLRGLFREIVQLAVTALFGRAFRRPGPIVIAKEPA